MTDRRIAISTTQKQSVGSTSKFRTHKNWNILTYAGTWTGRGGHASVAHNGVLYCVGGHTGAGYTTVHQAFDEVTKTWSSKLADPNARAFQGVAKNSIAGVYWMFVFGGFAGANSLSVHRRYNLVANTWTNLTATPQTAHYQPAVANSHYIYALGGIRISGGTTYPTTFWQYDVDAGTYNSGLTGPGINIARGHFLSFQDKIHSVGGYTNGVTMRTEQYVYDTVANSWSTTSDTGIPIASMLWGTAEAVGTNFYVTGSGASSVWRYHVPTKAWYNIGDVNFAPAYADAYGGIMNGWYYQIGGRSGASVGTTLHRTPV